MLCNLYLFVFAVFFSSGGRLHETQCSPALNRTPRIAGAFHVFCFCTTRTNSYSSRTWVVFHYIMKQNLPQQYKWKWTWGEGGGGRVLYNYISFGLLFTVKLQVWRSNNLMYFSFDPSSYFVFHEGVMPLALHIIVPVICCFNVAYS